MITLVERVPADEVVVAVRDPAKAPRSADGGIEVRRGDYADPNTLPAAFDGPTSCCWCRPAIQWPTA
jgi:uncharacterized protein YbjT (DUF2867 family)